MGPRGGVVTQRSAKPCTPVQFWSWPPSTKSMSCNDCLRGRTRARSASAGRVPTLRKRDQRPGLLVVIGDVRRLVEKRQFGPEIFLRNGFNRHSDGLQQSVVFNFTHGALPCSRAHHLKSLLVPY